MIPELINVAMIGNLEGHDDIPTMMAAVGIGNSIQYYQINIHRVSTPHDCLHAHVPVVEFWHGVQASFGHISANIDRIWTRVAPVKSYGS